MTSCGTGAVGGDDHDRAHAVLVVARGPTAADSMFTPASPKAVPTRPTMPGLVAVPEQRDVLLELEVEALAPGLEQVRAVLAADDGADDAGGLLARPRR